jgi:hypothetical protein
MLRTPHVRQVIFALSAIGSCSLNPSTWAQSLPTLQSLPEEVQVAIEKEVKDCEPQKAALDWGFIAKRYMNENGQGYILNYGHFVCGDSETHYCGSGGCLVQIFAPLPNGKYIQVLDRNVRDFNFSEIKGQPAIVLQLHGNECGKAGAESCSAMLIWNGRTFGPAAKENQQAPVRPRRSGVPRQRQTRTPAR